MTSEVVTKQDWLVRVVLSGDYVLNFIVDAVNGREALDEADNIKHLLEVPDDIDRNKEVGWEAVPLARNIRQVRRKYLCGDPIVPQRRHL